MGLFMSLYVLMHSKGCLGVLIGPYASSLIPLSFYRFFSLLMGPYGSLLIFFRSDGC